VGPRKVGSYFPLNPRKHPRRASTSVLLMDLLSVTTARVIQGRSEDGAEVTMQIQVADVGKVVESAREFLDTGNRSVLDRDEQGRYCSYLEHKASGHRTVVE